MPNIFELLNWNWSNSGPNLMIGVLTVFFSVFLSVVLVDGIRKRKRKKNLLTLLYSELTKLSAPKERAGAESIQMGAYFEIVDYVLYSNLLDIRRDCELISNLYKLKYAFENFNKINDITNGCLVDLESKSYEKFSKRRIQIYKQVFRQRTKSLKVLDSKYKVKSIL